MSVWICFQVTKSVWHNQEQHLLEMFPKCSVTEARSALSIAKGDMEEAVRLIIEGDIQLKCPPSLDVSSQSYNHKICFTCYSMRICCSLCVNAFLNVTFSGKPREGCIC